MGRGAEGWRAVTRVLRSCQAVGEGLARRTGGAVRSAVSDIAVATMPSECRVCGAAMATLGSVRVCETCVARAGLGAGETEDILCTRCGDALGMESARFAAARGVTECTMCRLAPPAFARAVAFADYDNEMREMLHHLKFDGARRMAETVLGERLARAAQRLAGATADELVVVPVPLFPARERDRGFNQATLLAQAAVSRLKRLQPAWRLRVASDALARVKDTRSLYRLSPRQRRANLRGAFRIRNAEAVRGREVLLIDDIMTTGATARECSAVLLRAGAAQVWVATVAKAHPEGVRGLVLQEPADVAMWSSGNGASFKKPDARRQVSF